MAQIRRETAIICSINDLLRGSFVRTEGWAPSYFATEVGNVSRVNLIGVSIERTPEGILIDDGSGRILLRSFDAPLPEVEMGSLIMVIGRPRVFNEQKYVVPELIKKVAPTWAEYRKIQLDNMPRQKQESPAEKRVAIKNDVPSQNPFQKIFDFIRDLDLGDGAELDDVVKRCGLSNGEELVRKLIVEGEIFEIKPGKLKILE